MLGWAYDARHPVAVAWATVQCQTGSQLDHPSHLREADVSTPPDFGGTEIEEGVIEDLGGPREVHPLSHRDAETIPYDDNELHAPGGVCDLCGKEIAPGDDVRRRADGKWVHEACPA
jgi:hypothetical protein